MDQLTSGMKKIRINLITQSQKDAREKARLAAQRTSSAPASGTASPAGQEKAKELPVPLPTSITPEPRTVHTEESDISPKQQSVSTDAACVPTPSTTVSSSGISTPYQEQDPFGAPDARQVALPMSSPPIPSVSVVQAGDVFIPYQPEGPPPVAIPQHDQQPLKWMPPNGQTSANTPAQTPSPAKKKDALFQYTAGIPFAPRQEQTPEDKVLLSKGAGPS